MASSAVPSVFQPVPIAGREYVDGGLVSPVPVRYARQMGAELVLAVDISSPPDGQATGDAVLEDRPVEFPRVDERLVGRRQQHDRAGYVRRAPDEAAFLQGVEVVRHDAGTADAKPRLDVPDCRRVVVVPHIRDHESEDRKRLCGIALGRDPLARCAFGSACARAVGLLGLAAHVDHATLGTTSRSTRHAAAPD